MPMGTGEKMGCTVTVNNARTELGMEEAGRGEVEARVILEKAGYGADEYDLFVADDRGTEPLDPGEAVSVAGPARFHAVRRSNPYG